MIDLTAEQCCYGRELLGWSQRRLALEAITTLVTLQRFESDLYGSSLYTRSAFRSALERGGVEFIPENGGGPGVRLRQAPTPLAIVS